MVSLSFDIEEFDTPMEYNAVISIDRQMSISKEGTLRILDLLHKHNIVATFFCTAHFAETYPDLIRQMANVGHEIASHGYYHSWFRKEHLLDSRVKLEEIIQSPVKGFRMARMMPVDEEEIQKAGYIYNSSLNPTFLPGRYNHLRALRTIHSKNGVTQIPASVTPHLRIPLFWLSVHHLPLWFYRFLILRTLKNDGYLAIYFHPWEFCELLQMPELRLPYIIKHNSGKKMVCRLESIIIYLKRKNYSFTTMAQLIP